MKKSVKRLYNEFQPRHYLITLDVDKDSMTFSGSLIVNGKKTSRPNQRITLHQHDLVITKTHVTKHDKTGDHDVAIDRINHHKSFDEVRLHSKEMLYPGNYTVRLEFTGKITRNMNGMYPCVFKIGGVEKTIIATQFESHHAREVFPCVDEPEAKATFELTLISPDGETVLSNTPIAKQTVIKSDESKSKTLKLKTTFQPTPHMSTYLLAFVFGEIEYLESKTKDGVLVRAYATPENVKFADFALEIAVKCLEFYNDYFGIDYPLKKCDLIALPDFASGAMENWGCVTFREQAMLVDPDNTTLASKQYVALVMAHELAHQWFGNLVTMRWWTDLWLNEGFASWIEYLAIDHFYPDWKLWTQFVVDEQQQALKLDALEYTHPVEAAVHHPDEIRTIFDAISYSKGASVIHMLHEYLGPKDFKNGLNHYLETHKYGNTDTVDLWDSLEAISGKPVREFMHSWTSQPGYPLINAELNDVSVKLTQSRFFTNPDHGNVKTELWPIPLLAGKTVPETFSTESIEFVLSDNKELKFNSGQSGFYRIAYNVTHIQRLGELIRKGHLSPIDRLGVLVDVFESAKAGHSDTADALHFLTNFTNEDDYAVWDSIAAAIGNLRLVMNDEELRENMKPYIRKLVAPQLKRLGWDRKPNDSHFDQLLRPIILGLAASVDEPTIIKRCLKLFSTIDDIEDVAPELRSVTGRKNVKRGIDIDPDLRGTVFGTVARLGGEAEFNKLLKLHNASTSSEERTTIAAALTGFKQPELIAQALALIDTDIVRLQDVAYWIAYSFLNRHGRQQTWDWVKHHWLWLQQNLGSDLSFYRMPIYAARVFSEKEFIDDYTKFFKPKMAPALERSYNQGLEMLQWQSAWKSRALPEVKTFFKLQK